MKPAVTWKSVAMALWRLVNAKQYKIHKLEKQIRRREEMKRLLIAIAVATAIIIALPIMARAENIVTNQDTAVVSTNAVTLVSGEVPAATNHPSNVFLNWLDSQVLEKIEIGATYSGRFESGSLKFQLGVSSLIKTPLEGTWNNVGGKGLSADWVVGVAETYVPAWNEFDVGLGVAVSIWRLPVKLADAQSKIPVVDVITPKLTILKAFVAVETPVDKVEARIVGGLTLPL